MKLKKIFTWILMFLPLIYSLISLQFLPDNIPMHYDMNLEVTRWGNKYEILILPILTIIFGLFMLGIGYFYNKKEEFGNNNEQVVITSCLVSLFLFNALTIYFIYLGFNGASNLTQTPYDNYKILFGIVGFGMIIIGNILPKMRMNALIGLRTKWSMKNETTWKLSQHFGGISIIIVGICIVIVSFFTKGDNCLMFSLIIIIVSLLIDTYYTYQITQKYE